MLSLKSLSRLVLAAAFAVFAGAASAQTVRVNYIPITDVTPLFVAIDKGYFAAEGLTIVPTPSTEETSTGLSNSLRKETS